MDLEIFRRIEKVSEKKLIGNRLAMSWQRIGPKSFGKDLCPEERKSEILFRTT